jgi:hypothetical protein
MIISAAEIEIPVAMDVEITADTLGVELSDGRRISVPLSWYPRLLYGTDAERRRWRLIGRGQGIHWPLLDEDISVEGLLAGKPSGESQASFKRWLANRPQQETKSKRSPSTTSKSFPIRKSGVAPKARKK